MSSDSVKGMSPRVLVNMLAEIERRSRDCARNLTAAEYPDHLWQGLVFTVGGVRLVSDMHEVSELLRIPDAITRVPGSKSWLVGIANVRGNLLTVVDLQAYLGDKPIVTGKSSRVLVIQRGPFTAGLLVPSVIGMREFDFEHRLSNARLEGAVGAYVYEAFQIDRELWPVFNMRALATDPRFVSAAL